MSTIRADAVLWDPSKPPDATSEDYAKTLAESFVARGWAVLSYRDWMTLHYACEPECRQSGGWPRVLHVRCPEHKAVYIQILSADHSLVPQSN
jgi:hypothetical protein